MNNMAVVNVNNLLNIKDSRWLQLEVCREFQRNKCSRPDTECKFAHPPANVEVQNGRVTACYDSIKGRCNREKPPCKYFHPPPHLKDQLLINGRNHLALKNALMQQMGLAPGQPVVPGQVPAVATNPYLAGVTSQAYNPYFAAGPLVPLVTSDPTGASVVSPLGVPQQTVVTQQKVPRADRLEFNYGLIANGLLGPSPMKICISHNDSPNSNIEIIEEFGGPGSPELRELRSTFSSLYGPQYKLTVQEKSKEMRKLVTYPGMVAYKRPAGDKSGVPVYQPANTPSAAAYQQLMQLQQPFVPVSSTSIQHSNATMTTASSSNSVGGITTATSVQDHNNSVSGGLANGSLDSHGNDTGLKRITKAESENESGDHHDGSSSLNINNTGNDLDEEAKAESANKRMRVQNVGSGGQANVSQVPNPMGQNNAAYVAAAQSYHNALAAMTYTGVALQTNKAQQQQASAPVPQSHGYPGSAAAAAAAAAAFQQQHQGYQSQQSQQQQQQQSQQQQLLSQYQAMAAAAALANQGTFQGGAYASQQASNNANQQSANNAAAAAALNMNMNAASAAAGLNPFAAMNPLLAASIPQFAAAQRAGLLANQQQGQQALQSAQFNSAALAAAGLPTGSGGGNPGAGMAFNPFGVQFAAGPAGGSSANALQFQGNQQALLAAYGQFARAPVPVAAVSAAPTLTTQQIYVGNQAAAAAAAAAAAGSGALQAGVKRLRPQ
ncbi:unnamed protein product [Allacma fusca]|uniref:C3H1-type domain-containing protein n=1 Tax=Allacma fusca TaxID=39272 RepID=A0A8J2KGU2_9HEXA|nr:unnamed protein product [Allacma fusca]